MATAERSAISLIVMPFMSPVSENARRVAARIELFLASRSAGAGGEARRRIRPGG